MVVKKYYGRILLDSANNKWVITEARPHVAIKLKAIFGQIPKADPVPFKLANTNEMCESLLWFMTRYPLEISPDDFNVMCDGKQAFADNVNRLEEILLPNYKPKAITLSNGFTPRDYQMRAADLHYLNKRFLLGDDLGLGKTLSAILTFFNPGTLPAVVVVQAHLTIQWRNEIKKFTNLRTHVIKTRTMYDLPEADVYIIKYTCLYGWVDLFETGFFKSVVFDEIQELRHAGTNKYQASKHLSDAVEFCMGMSATPIYNYGDEIYNVLSLIKTDCLGERYDFLREWASRRGMNHVISDPDALGTYLRDNYLFIRRTRKDVGRELPPINKIIQSVDYDEDEARKSEKMAELLAIRMFKGSFMERGSAARELDMMLRQSTGVAKAPFVAECVRIILESGEPVVLAGWHRDVYKIWQDKLKEFNPVLYTGTESPKQKDEAAQKFINGETNLFIISLRSGIGLDGLQKRCNIIVFGELDWSPKVHDQLVGRIDRDGRDTGQLATAIYCVCDYGSDPSVMDVLGLKASQAHSIVDPLTAPVTQLSDDSRIQTMAKRFLDKKGIVITDTNGIEGKQPELF